MEKLNWKVVNETKRGRYLEAHYFAYKAPDGRNIEAVAKVSPSVYFPGTETEYETIIIDSFLKEIGSNSYIAKYSYGHEIGGDHMEDAKKVCEKYGVQLTKDRMRNIDIRRMYENSLREIALWYLDNEIAPDFYRIISIDHRNMEVAAEVETGGDHSEYHIRINKDMTIESYAS